MNSNTLTLNKTAESGLAVVLERIDLGTADTAAADSDAPAWPTAEPVRTEEQQRLLPIVGEHVRAHTLGVHGVVILLSRDHNRLSVYTQIEPAHADALPPVVDIAHRAGIPARTIDRRVFDLVWQDGNEQPTTVSVEHTPVVHFGLFTVLDGRADELLDKIEENAPASLPTPGLLTVNFHRSHDSERFVNFGTWATLDQFAQLLQQPGFHDHAVYWKDLAFFENDYSDVVEVVDPGRTDG